jgi:hypothetical protein
MAIAQDFQGSPLDCAQAARHLFCSYVLLTMQRLTKFSLSKHRPNAPLAERVQTSIAGEMRKEYRRRLLGE